MATRIITGFVASCLFIPICIFSEYVVFPIVIGLLCLIGVFERMRKNIKNGTILIISHQERILNIADEIIVVADGKVEKRGNSGEVLSEILKVADRSFCERLEEGGNDNA